MYRHSQYPTPELPNSPAMALSGAFKLPGGTPGLGFLAGVMSQLGLGSEKEAVLVAAGV